MMNENRIIETLKYISKFVESRHDEGLGDYLHIVIGRTDINVIDETIHLLERKQKKIEEMRKELQMYVDVQNNDIHNYISKDKIREKIKELEGQEDWYIESKSLDDLYGRIDELKELLEEK